MHFVIEFKLQNVRRSIHIKNLNLNETKILTLVKLKTLYKVNVVVNGFGERVIFVKVNYTIHVYVTNKYMPKRDSNGLDLDKKKVKKPLEHKTKVEYLKSQWNLEKSKRIEMDCKVID